jgi:hypothetical protein
LTCEWSNTRTLIISDSVRLRASSGNLWKESPWSHTDRRSDRALDGGLVASFARGSGASTYSAVKATGIVVFHLYPLLSPDRQISILAVRMYPLLISVTFIQPLPVQRRLQCSPCIIYITHHPRHISRATRTRKSSCSNTVFIS